MSLYINDPDAIILFDEENSDAEERFIAIGRRGSAILFVSFTMRDDVERIISCRKAEPEEEKRYWRGVV